MGGSLRKNLILITNDDGWREGVWKMRKLMTIDDSQNGTKTRIYKIASSRGIEFEGVINMSFEIRVFT